MANELLMAREQVAEPVEVRLAEVRLEDEPRAQLRPAQRGRRGHPFAARPPAEGAARAVRAHERGARTQPGQRTAGNGRRGARRPAANDEEEQVRDARQQAELQRFLEMARRDEEEGWDSDELGEEEGFRIEVR